MASRDSKAETISTGGSQSQRAKLGVDLDEIQRWIEIAKGNQPEGVEVDATPEAGLTTTEWAERWKVSTNLTRVRLRAMKSAGVVEVAEGRRVNLRDKEYMAVVYRVRNQ